MTGTGKSRVRRRLLQRTAAALLLSGALAVLLPPLEGAAAPEALIVFDDDSSCEVSMQDIHRSSTNLADVSVAVDVRCHPAGAPRAKLAVDEITAQTTISFSETKPIPGFFPPDEIGTCQKITFSNRPSAKLPCHQIGRSPAGYYVGSSIVTATFRGQTEELQVSRQAFLGGFA